MSTDDGDIVSWSAHHDGYQDLEPPATHRRTVELDRRRRRLEILDEIESIGTHGIRMTFHLGPAVEVDLEGSVAHLRWASLPGARRATFHLPDALLWSAHRGELDPILGWYAPRFGLREPTTTLVGIGSCSAVTGQLRSVLEVAG
jgi:hypothetical protein